MFQTQVILRLAKRYGRQITLSNPELVNTDLKTGNVSRTFSKKVIKKALCLPAEKKKDQSNTFNRNTNFEYGGVFETEDILVIFATKVLGDFRISNKTILELDGHRYTPRRIDRASGEYFEILFHSIEDIDLGRQVARPNAAKAVASVDQP